MLALEHGILDIVEQGVTVLLQSGHTEKAVSIYQGLLELNLFSPSFPGPGYTVSDKLSLMEPIWDSGVARVGQVGARGWGVELQDRIERRNHELEQGEEVVDTWEEEVLGKGGLEKGAMWLQLEVGREREQFFPWRQGQEEPEDPDRIVDFDSIQEWMCQFSREETKFRLLLSFLRLLGVRWADRTFSPLTHSGASDHYLGVAGYQAQDFGVEDARILQPVLPEVSSSQTVATFTNYLLQQTYSR